MHLWQPAFSPLPAKDHCLNHHPSHVETSVLLYQFIGPCSDFLTQEIHSFFLNATLLVRTFLLDFLISLCSVQINNCVLMSQDLLCFATLISNVPPLIIIYSELLCNSEFLFLVSNGFSKTKWFFWLSLALQTPFDLFNTFLDYKCFSNLCD